MKLLVQGAQVLREIVLVNQNVHVPRGRILGVIDIAPVAILCRSIAGRQGSSLLFLIEDVPDL